MNYFTNITNFFEKKYKNRLNFRFFSNNSNCYIYQIVFLLVHLKKILSLSAKKFNLVTIQIFKVKHESNKKSISQVA